MKLRNILSTAIEGWRIVLAGLKASPSYNTAEAACRASSDVWIDYHAESLRCGRNDTEFAKVGRQLAVDFAMAVDIISRIDVRSFTASQAEDFPCFQENIADRARQMKILLEQGAEALEEQIVSLAI